MLDFVKEKHRPHGLPKTPYKFCVLINEASASAQDYGRDKMEKEILDILDICSENICFFTPDTSQIAHRFLDENKDCPLLIGGGDGTVLAMAEHFLKHKINRAFGVLPLGTMNLFARSINVPLTLKEALKAYCDHSQNKADIVEVNGRYFLCAAALGLIPTLSEIREDHREDGLLGAMPEMSEKALGDFEGEKQQFEIRCGHKNQILQATNIVISNQHYTQEDSHNLVGGFNGKGHDDGAIYSYILRPSGMADQLRFLTRLSFGSWLDDPAIDTIKCSDGLTIDTENDTEKIALDGEVYTVETPLHFKMHHKALNILMPNSD